MAVEDQPKLDELDEGSWIYLSTGSGAQASKRDLIESVVEACAESGWRTVTHPPPRGKGISVDPGRFFASLSHAVEHADVVVAVIGEQDEMADAELTLAYSHGRPVVGLQIGKASFDSQVRRRLGDYERAKVVTCSSPGECALTLRETLADPAFAETIRQAW